MFVLYSLCLNSKFCDPCYNPTLNLISLKAIGMGAYLGQACQSFYFINPIAHLLFLGFRNTSSSRQDFWIMKERPGDTIIKMWTHPHTNTEMCVLVFVSACHAWSPELFWIKCWHLATLWTAMPFGIPLPTRCRFSLPNWNFVLVRGGLPEPSARASLPLGHARVNFQCRGRV